MKQRVFFVLCVLAAVGVSAQSHTFRDTSYTKYYQFDLEGWLLTDPANHSLSFANYVLYPGTQTGMVCNDILQYNYTNNPDGLDIAGLSAVIFTGIGMPLYYPMDPPEYLLLYDAMTDTCELRGQLQWEETDTAGRPNFDMIFGTVDSTVHHWTDYYGQPAPRGLTVFDLYFDKPIRVYDSFYVGGTARFLDMLEPHNISMSSYFAYRLYQYDTSNNSLTDYYPILWKVFRYCNGYNIHPINQWYWIPSNQFLMILPIISVVDTSFANAPECPRVSGLFVRGSYTDTVTMQWGTDGVHRVFEVSYGREGTAPEDGTVVTVYDTLWRFTDTAYREIPMVSYVRTECREYDTVRWSGWSPPLRWRLHHEADTGGHGGIGVPEEEGDLSRFVRLMPNPASGSVVVMSSYGIDRVEVYDMRGERVLEQKGRSTTLGFDASTWPRGAYVVVVRTPAGTSTKKLVVK